jgi:hypothetical protein
VDLALQRQFHLTERLGLRFRAEFFNIFNHPNFGSPTNTLTSPLFGYSTQMLASSLAPPMPASTPSTKSAAPLHPARSQAPILTDEPGADCHSTAQLSLVALWDFHCERKTTVSRSARVRSVSIVVRENDIAGEETKNQQHPDRLSLMGPTNTRHVTLLRELWRKTLKNQTDFSVGTLRMTVTLRKLLCSRALWYPSARSWYW